MYTYSKSSWRITKCVTNLFSQTSLSCPDIRNLIPRNISSATWQAIISLLLLSLTTTSVMLLWTNRNLDEDVLQNCTNIMEASLSNVYREGREDNLIGPIELRVIKEGTFEDLKALAVKGGASPAQFKLPRSISNLQTLQLLNDKTLVSFRSTAAIVRPSRSRIQQLTSFNKHL